MRNRIMGHTLAAMTFAVAVHGQERPNFTGTWVIDDSASSASGGQRGDPRGNASGGGGRQGGGMGLGPPATRMTVRQDSLTFVVDEDRGDGITTVRYWLNGARMRNQMPVGRGGTRMADYVTRWDGPRLVTAITSSVGRGSTVTTLEHRETRYLDDQGRMVVEVSLVGQSATRRTVYRRTG